MEGPLFHFHDYGRKGRFATGAVQSGSPRPRLAMAAERGRLTPAMAIVEKLPREADGKTYSGK